jgi:endoglucanase
LVWAALWLYKATGTQSYLTYATNGYSAFGFSGNTDVLSWDSKIAGIKVLLAQITGQASYLTDVQNLCNNFINQVPKSPLGEAFFSQWGSLRYAASGGFICLMVSLSIFLIAENTTRLFSSICFCPCDTFNIFLVNTILNKCS